MLVAALLLILVIPLIAAACKVVPPDSVGLVERFGRLLPEIRKPGLVIIRPYIERLFVLPNGPIPLVLETDSQLGGRIPVHVTVEVSCAIMDPVKFQQNVPIPPRTRGVPARISGFLGALLESEGRALLRELSPIECLSEPRELSRRLSERLEWHTRRVGLSIPELNIAGFGLPPEETDLIRLQAQAERARRDAGPPP